MFPRWLSWLFILLMGYLIYVGNRAAHTPHPSPDIAASVEVPTHDSTSIANYPALQQFTNADRWKRAMNPAYIGDAKIADKIVGTGALAQCGSNVTVHLRGTLADGANFDETHNESKPLQFTLGDAPYPVLNQALTGMHQGGVRQISAPPQEVYSQGAHKTRDDVLLRVELDAVDAPEVNQTGLGLKVIQEKGGNGAAAICGKPISIAMRLWNAAGTIAYQTPQPIAITLGKDALPEALTEGLDAIRVGETRTLVMPLQSKSLTSKLPMEIRKALGSDKVVILSVTRSV